MVAQGSHMDVVLNKSAEQVEQKRDGEVHIRSGPQLRDSKAIEFSRDDAHFGYILNWPAFFLGSELKIS